MPKRPLFLAVVRLLRRRRFPALDRALPFVDDRRVVAPKRPCSPRDISGRHLARQQRSRRRQDPYPGRSYQAARHERRRAGESSEYLASVGRSRRRGWRVRFGGVPALRRSEGSCRCSRRTAAKRFSTTGRIPPSARREPSRHSAASSPRAALRRTWLFQYGGPRAGARAGADVLPAELRGRVLRDASATPQALGSARHRKPSWRHEWTAAGAPAARVVFVGTSISVR